MLNQYLLVGLIYIAISLVITIIVSIFHQPRVQNRLVPIFFVALAASFSGGILYAVFDGFFDFLASFQGVNMYPPLAAAVIAVFAVLKITEDHSD